MFPLSISLLFTVALPLIHSHSWVDIVGWDGGRMRGYRMGAGDLELQRYVCDQPILSDCQPDPKHNIVYPDDAMWPCRVDNGRIKASRAASGTKLYVMWMGNGHANQQSFGQPVYIYITPYKARPNFSDFTLLTTVPYFYCEDGGRLCDRPKTDTELTLPTGVGKYTIFWKWPFTDFVYGSCFDVEVLPVGSKPTPVRPTPPIPIGPVNPTVEHGKKEYLQYGCRYDVECRGVGEEYCKLWLKDDCGRSVCHGSNVALNACSPSDAVTPRQPPTHSGDCGRGSYCKCWQDPPVCHGTDSPCTCNH